MLDTSWIVAIIFLLGSYMFFSNLLPVVAVTKRNPLQWGGWGEGGLGTATLLPDLFLYLSQNHSVVREQYADLFVVHFLYFIQYVLLLWPAELVMTNLLYIPLVTAWKAALN